jgi:hypothetical protein
MLFRSRKSVTGPWSLKLFGLFVNSRLVFLDLQLLIQILLSDQSAEQFRLRSILSLIKFFKQFIDAEANKIAKHHP